MISAGERVQKNHLVVSQRAADKIVLLRIADGQYYSLDEVGARAWELCNGTRTVDELITKLMEEYEAPESAREELMEFLQELHDSGLLVRGD